MKYSDIRDSVHEVLASVMTATPLGSNASFDQLGDTRRKLVARCAEAVGDEISKMIEQGEKYRKPSDRYDRDMNDYSEPGKYDDDDTISPSSSNNTSGDHNGELFS